MNAASQSLFAWHCWRRDVSNFALLKHRHFDGFLITMQHSGTHWLKYMMSVALARQLGLPPPRYIHNDSSNDFIGHPKHPRRYLQAPRIASAHSIPHALFDSRIVRAAVKFPRYVVLVRDMRAALVSNYEKWKTRYEVTFSEYLQGDLRGKGYFVDIWDFLHFYNRWSRVARRFPDDTLVLKYEALSADPASALAMAFSHLGIAIDNAHIEGAVVAGSKDNMAARLNPDDPVRNIVRANAAAPQTWFSAPDRAFFDAVTSRHLRGDFAYKFEW